MNAISDTTTSLEARRVPDDDRIHTLPRHFGFYALAFEDAVFKWMRLLAHEYEGYCYWHFYEVPDFGCYLAPECGPLRVRAPLTGFTAHLSADAAGITACLYALSELTLETDAALFRERYCALLEFARHHAEAEAIFGAIH